MSDNPAYAVDRKSGWYCIREIPSAPAAPPECVAFVRQAAAACEMAAAPVLGEALIRCVEALEHYERGGLSPEEASASVRKGRKALGRVTAAFESILREERGVHR